MQTIALIAHDKKKDEMLDFVGHHLTELKKFNLVATHTTGTLINEKYHLNVDTKMSGPLGGDQQIGAMIAEREIDMLIFFCDNLIVQGHQNDVSALTRLAALYNIAFATNRTTADMLLTSSLLDDPNYEIQIPDVIAHYANRKLK
jgi:methylglyoxal synthase